MARFILFTALAIGWDRLCQAAGLHLFDNVYAFAVHMLPAPFVGTSLRCWLPSAKAEQSA